jgi:hypothetical protein
MINNQEYLFEIGDEVVYFPGNWHYVVKGRGVIKDDIYYMVECAEELCEECPHEDIFMAEDELQSYEEYCDHGCNECEHQTKEEIKNCTKIFND